MKDRFIRVLSPITIGVVMLLDCGVIYFAYFAISKAILKLDIKTILFIIIELFALIISALITKQVFSGGVKFKENYLEFTELDEHNIFEYEGIEKIVSSKDEKASLRKNFVDRYSSIIFYMKDSTVVTVELGLTTKKTLNKIINEINIRMRDSH